LSMAPSDSFMPGHNQVQVLPLTNHADRIIYAVASQVRSQMIFLCFV